MQPLLEVRPVPQDDQVLLADLGPALPQPERDRERHPDRPVGELPGVGRESCAGRWQPAGQPVPAVQGRRVQLRQGGVGRLNPPGGVGLQDQLQLDQVGPALAGELQRAGPSRAGSADRPGPTSGTRCRPSDGGSPRTFRRAASRVSRSACGGDDGRLELGELDLGLGHLRQVPPPDLPLGLGQLVGELATARSWFSRAHRSTRANTTFQYASIVPRTSSCDASLNWKYDRSVSIRARTIGAMFTRNPPPCEAAAGCSSIRPPSSVERVERRRVRLLAPVADQVQSERRRPSGSTLDSPKVPPRQVRPRPADAQPERPADQGAEPRRVRLAVRAAVDATPGRTGPVPGRWWCW